MAITPKKPITLPPLSLKNAIMEPKQLEPRSAAIPLTAAPAPPVPTAVKAAPAPVVASKPAVTPVVVAKAATAKKPVVAKVQSAKLTLVKKAPGSPITAIATPAQKAPVESKPDANHNAPSTSEALTSLSASWLNALRQFNAAQLDHVKSLTGTKTLAEAFALQSAFASAQVAMVQKHGLEISALSQKIAQGSFMPLAEKLAKTFATH